MTILFVLSIHLAKVVASIVLTELSAAKFVDAVLETNTISPDHKITVSDRYTLFIMASIIVMSATQVCVSLLDSLLIVVPVTFLLEISQGVSHMSNIMLILTAFVAYGLSRMHSTPAPSNLSAHPKVHTGLSIDGAALIETTEDTAEDTQDSEDLDQPKEPSQQSQANYISAAAHDLNTPLQSFSLGLDLLKQTGLSPAQEEIVAQTAVAVDLMKLTIAQAVDAQRLAGGFQLQPQKAFTALGSVVDRVTRIIRGYGITVPVSFNIAPSVSEGIQIDEDWLWQMLTTLVFTACKNTAHEIRICIDVRKNLQPAASADFVRGSNQDLLRNVLKRPLVISTSNAVHLVFEVTTLCGDAECCNAAVWPASACSGEGDIGLYIVRARVDAMGGMCGSRSTADTTTNTVDGAATTSAVVWFAVPYAPVTKAFTPKMPVCSPVGVNDVESSSNNNNSSSSGNSGDEVVAVEVEGNVSRRSSVNSTTSNDSTTSTTSAAHSESCGSPTHYAGSTTSTPSSRSAEEEALRRRIRSAGLTAMLVEDTMTIRKLMERTLLQLGFASVACYENGQLGLDAMLAAPVDIVFSDVQMPVMCGDAMVREFRSAEPMLLSRTRRQLVVAITANGNEFTDLQGCGFDSVAPKPVSKKTLLAVVESYLDSVEGVESA